MHVINVLNVINLRTYVCGVHQIIASASSVQKKQEEEMIQHNYEMAEQEKHQKTKRAKVAQALQVSIKASLRDAAEAQVAGGLHRVVDVRHHDGALGVHEEGRRRELHLPRRPRPARCATSSVSGASSISWRYSLTTSSTTRSGCARCAFCASFGCCGAAAHWPASPRLSWRPGAS